MTPMFASPKKYDAQLERRIQKMEPWRRKHYRKARFRKMESRSKLWDDIHWELICVDLDEVWKYKYHEIWVY